MPFSHLAYAALEVWLAALKVWQPGQHPGLGAGRGPLRGGCPEVTSPKPKKPHWELGFSAKGSCFLETLTAVGFEKLCSTHSKKRPLRHGLLKRHHSDAGVLLRTNKDFGCQGMPSSFKYRAAGHRPGSAATVLPPLSGDQFFGPPRNTQLHFHVLQSQPYLGCWKSCPPRLGHNYHSTFCGHHSKRPE